MATHYSILAWRIPWTEEPGRPQSWGPKESDMTEQLKVCLFQSKPAATATYFSIIPTLIFQLFRTHFRQENEAFLLILFLS